MLCFKDNLLCVPGFAFEKVCSHRMHNTSTFHPLQQASPWHDTGSSTLIAEGQSLKDGGLVLAKIAPAHSTSSLCLHREAHM